MTNLRRAVTVWLGLTLGASALAAQYRSAGQWGAGVRLGVSPYDLDGTGTALVIGAQVDRALSKTFLGEVGFPLLDRSSTVRFADIEASERTRLLLPEVSLQAQASLGRAQPYIFAGGGAAVSLNGHVAGGGTLHAGLGTRVLVGRRTLLRFEARARSIRPWAGETVDLTVGLEWIKE